MEISKWIIVGICAVGVAAHLIWTTFGITKMLKNFKKDKSDKDVSNKNKRTR